MTDRGSLADELARRYDARYRALPKISPYITTERYGRPKETFKCVVRELRAREDTSRPLSLLDVACANGEFLYYLRQEFPHFTLAGVDYTPEFIEVARSSGRLDGVSLTVQDLFDVTGVYDIVTFLGTAPSFPEIDRPLEKLLELCKPGGLLVVEGFFNPYDIEVRTIYSDSSTPEGRGLWRVDWNRHSRRSVRELLAGKVRDLDFVDVDMGVELPRDPTKPHINSWTFKDAQGRNIITNGTQMLMNTTMLIVRR